MSKDCPRTPNRLVPTSEGQRSGTGLVVVGGVVVVGEMVVVGAVVVGAVVVVVGGTVVVGAVVVGAAVVDAEVSATSVGPDDPLQPPTVSSKAARNTTGRYIRFGASGVPRGLHGHRV